MPVTERQYDFNASINTETAVIAATTDRVHIVKRAKINLSAGGPGVVVFKDGVGGTTILSKLLQASASGVREVELNEADFGASGKRLTKGNALTATLAGATLQGTFYCVDEDVS